MMTTADLQRGITNQITRLRAEPGTLDPSHSELLLTAATLQWQHTSEQEDQEWWRRAAIAHMAILGLKGEWSRAAAVTDDPVGRGTKASSYPKPLTPNNKKLAALMLTNMAICRYRTGKPAYHTEVLVDDALAYFGQIDDRTLDRWWAVLWTLKAIIWKGDSAKSEAHAARAVTALGHLHNPQLVELHLLALHLGGYGDGIVHSGLLGRHNRPANIQAAECLYFFQN